MHIEYYSGHKLTLITHRFPYLYRAPTLVSSLKSSHKSGWPSAHTHPSRVKQQIAQQIANGYGTYLVSSPSSSLHAKKKKGGGGGGGTITQPVSKNGKILMENHTHNISKHSNQRYPYTCVLTNAPLSCCTRFQLDCC